MFVQSLIALFLTSLAVMGSPGPATISVTAVGAAFGLRRSLAYVSGIMLGTVMVLIAVATGILAALASIPYVRLVLIAASALYMLYLAFRIATAPPLAKEDGTTPPPSFAAGLLLAVANPKAYLAIAAVFAGSKLADDIALDSGFKTAILALMIVVIHLAWLLAGASLSGLLRDPVTSRIINLVLAGALAGATILAIVPDL